MKILELIFKDIDGFDVKGLNVSLFEEELLKFSTITNEYGNATYVNLPEN